MNRARRHLKTTLSDAARSVLEAEAAAGGCSVGHVIEGLVLCLAADVVPRRNFEFHRDAAREAVKEGERARGRAAQPKATAATRKSARGS